MPIGELAGYITQIVIYGGVFGVAIWAYRKGRPLMWYELLLIVLGLLLGAFAVQYVLNTGILQLILLLIPAITFLIVAWQLILRRQRSTSSE